LEAFASQQNAQHAFLFYGYKSEPKIQEWARQSSNVRSYYMPVVRNDGLMGFVRWQHGDAMVENRFGISEPTGTQLSRRDIEKLNGLLIVVPALSVDRDGFRLGYGGGFYDRFLAENRTATAVAVTYAKLCDENVPRESFDIPVHACITEDGLQSF
jgi:5-formyltetrahydrofolate cyclo-ligase